MHILVTNDDGIDAPGLAALARALHRWRNVHTEHEVVIAAPLRNHSGMSAALGDVFSAPPVHYERRTLAGAESVTAYAVDAPPALCATIGALGTFGAVPDLVISGINEGANIGRSILHSGTVGAVLTAGQMGISGLAVSVQWGPSIHYDTAAHVAVEVVEHLFRAPQQTMLNLNVPNLPGDQLRGIRRARISGAAVVAAAGPAAGGEAVGDVGVLPLRMGAATHELGDVSDEDADDDGALLVAGYATLTALSGPHEETNPALDSVLHGTVGIIEAALARYR